MTDANPEINKTTDRSLNMKLKVTLGALIAGLLLTAPASLFAQNGPGSGPKGRGYGGPPQSQSEVAPGLGRATARSGGPRRGALPHGYTHARSVDCGPKQRARCRPVGQMCEESGFFSRGTSAHQPSPVKLLRRSVSQIPCPQEVDGPAGIKHLQGRVGDPGPRSQFDAGLELEELVRLSAKEE
jgi:hypothetical protein